MILFFNSVTTIALSLLVLSARGFPRQGMPRRNIRSCSPSEDRRNAILFDSPRIKIVGKAFALPNDENESEKWTMEEDWALLDNLPLFTMSSMTETRTFWTQLWSANAILFSRKKPEDLYQRVQELECRRASRREGQKTKLENDEKSHDRQSPSLTFGASPPVLENWKIEGSDNKVVGQVVSNASGQRTIWFNYHVIGRLEGDPFADKSSSVAPLFPGGYIEAIGGRVYELGQPMLLDEWEKYKANTSSNEREKIDAGDPVRGGGESLKSSAWLFTGSTAAISAFVSSTILSACIGYGAGLSIIQDSSHHHTAASRVPTMLTVETVLAGPSQNGVGMSSQSPTTLSREELKTRAQYKVLREEKLLEKISQRLELDKQNLRQLEQEQQQSPSSKLLP